MEKGKREIGGGREREGRKREGGEGRVKEICKMGEERKKI